jgi:hypothetical protein
MRPTLIGAVLVAWLVGSGASLHGHAQETAQEAELPPLVYVCPMHSDQVSHEEGECPICQMGLEPMRLDSVFTCPIHSVVAERHAGKCPICARPLGEVTVSVVFRCGGVDEDLIEPRACADGTAAVRVQRSLAHGNHNPQQGGQFFMAADSWHHIEGAYPAPGVFRLYLYDDYTKPLSAARFAGVKARAVTKEQTDPQTFVTTEAVAVPLTPSADGTYLEGKLESLPLPANVTVQAAFTPGSKEQRFDFTFADYSVAAAAETLDGATRLALDVPADAPGVLALLLERRDSVQDIVARGAFSEVWVPALQAKELALALEMHAREFPEQRRLQVETAAREVVLAAFRLDAAGDRGEREQVLKSFDDLVHAVGVFETAFGSPR